MTTPVPVAILGPTGYTGLELIELLSRHPSMRIAYLASARTPSPRIDEEFPRLAARMGAASAECGPIDADAIAQCAKLAFLCLPHEAAMEHVPPLLDRGVKVVDLSAAYRLSDAGVYEQAYGHAQTDAKNLPRAVYGLTEWAREDVKKADLVANPGCYPTAAALALIPLLKAGLIRAESIIINAASGVSGAGRGLKTNLHYVEANENFSPYGIGVHRHQPEIAQSLVRWGGQKFPRQPLFVPHLLPVERGILETMYAEPTTGGVDAGVTTERLQSTLKKAYEHEPFVVVRESVQMITLRDVVRTNMVHINARVSHGRVVVVAAEDNLVKGASGQAIQNANLMMGLDETAGLR